MEQPWLTNIMLMAGESEPEEAAPVMRALISRAKAGDNAAFEQIIIRYQRQVFGTACRLLTNRDDARDAAQEVFLRLHKYLHRFDEARELSPWLYQLTVNVCRELARKRRRAPTQSLEEEYQRGTL